MSTGYSYPSFLIVKGKLQGSLKFCSFVPTLSDHTETTARCIGRTFRPKIWHWVKRKESNVVSIGQLRTGVTRSASELFAGLIGEAE